MKLQYLLSFLLACVVVTAQAQTAYDQLETGAVVQGGIGMGVFSKPLPLPGGPWKLLSRKAAELPLINSRDKTPAGSVSSYALTLRSLERDSLIPVIIVSITEQRSNLDQGSSPCHGSNNRDQWFDDFSEKTGNGNSGCATSIGLSDFRLMVANAPDSSIPWIKYSLQELSAQANSLPDNVVVVEISVRRFRGKFIRVVFILKQEANLTDAAYANHLKPWIHATGLALLATVENDTATIALPQSFAAMDPSREIPKNFPSNATNNRAESTSPDTVPVKDIRIPSRFDIVEITAENLLEKLQQCIPQFSANGYLPPVNVAGVMINASGSSRTFLLKKSKGLCIYRSSANFPIFAAEEFIQTVTPVGVSKDVVEQWNQQIAELVAKKGVARIAYVFQDGSASIARYWVGPGNSLELNYTAQPKSVGEWKEQDVDARLTDPALVSVSLTNANTKGEGKKSQPY